MKDFLHRLAVLVALACAWLIAGPAYAQVTIASPGQGYGQNFNTLIASGTSQPWANNTTLTGWNLFAQPAPGAAIGAYSAGDGSSNSGSFYSFGTIGTAERALGGVASGGAYFGSPASGAVAGWIAAEFINLSGQTLDGFALRFDGEQWRNGGNTSAQAMVFEYGFGSSFQTVASWSAPGGAFDWSSPLFSASAAAVDGNTVGSVTGRGGAVSATWNPNDSLWIRWIERNDIGNDHGLAIDNVGFTAGNVLLVPEPGGLALLLAGIAGVAGVGRQSRRH